MNLILVTTAVKALRQARVKLYTTYIVIVIYIYINITYFKNILKIPEKEVITKKSDYVCRLG